MHRRRDNSNRYLGMVMADAITMGIAIWLGYTGGTWLDEQFGTYPIFMFILVLMAIAGSFQLILRDVLREGRSSPGQKKPSRDVEEDAPQSPGSRPPGDDDAPGHSAAGDGNDNHDDNQDDNEAQPGHPKEPGER